MDYQAVQEPAAKATTMSAPHGDPLSESTNMTGQSQQPVTYQQQTTTTTSIVQKPATGTAAMSKPQGDPLHQSNVTATQSQPPYPGSGTTYQQHLQHQYPASTGATTGAAYHHGTSSHHHHNQGADAAFFDKNGQPTVDRFYHYIDPSKPATVCDNLYIASVFMACFAATLSFPGAWNVALHFDRVTASYVAFAFIFLVFAFMEAIILVAGLTAVPVQRVEILQKTMILTVFNILVLVVAIATEFTGYDRLGYWVPGLEVAPACLLAALVLMACCLALQISAQAITNKKVEGKLAAYLPIVFVKHVVRDLLIANAILSTIVLAFAVGSLIFLAPIRVQRFSDIYYAGVALTVAFFFFALIAFILSVIALYPSDIPNRMTVLITWVLHVFTFATALTAWFLQLYSDVEIIEDQHLMVLLGWIVALSTLVLGIATFCILDERVGCCNENRALLNSKDLADIERHRLEALQYRKQREALEREHGVYSVQQPRHVPVPSHQIV